MQKHYSNLLTNFKQYATQQSSIPYPNQTPSRKVYEVDNDFQNEINPEKLAFAELTYTDYDANYVMSPATIPKGKSFLRDFYSSFRSRTNYQFWD